MYLLEKRFKLFNFSQNFLASISLKSTLITTRVRDCQGPPVLAHQKPPPFFHPLHRHPTTVIITTPPPPLGCQTFIASATSADDTDDRGSPKEHKINRKLLSSIKRSQVRSQRRRRSAAINGFERC